VAATESIKPAAAATLSRGASPGRSKRWLKIKNPDSPAMQRVREETSQARQID